MDDATVSPTPPDKHSEEPIDAGSPSTTFDTLQYDRITQDCHIRVLDLAPGSWDEPVTCSLRTVDLHDDELHYEAISYAWGDPIDRKTVVCNGCAVSTTRNLFEALQRFRYADTTRTLWADALCINQADNEERTAQVRLMSFIYTKAARVLVWLQHEDDQVVQDSLNAICRYILRSDGFARFPQIFKHQQNLQTLYKWRDVPVFNVSRDDPPEVGVAAINALRHLCSSPWFRRGWIIQEAALSTSTSVFWGHAEIGFEWLGITTSMGLLSPSSSYDFGGEVARCYFLFQLSPFFMDPGAVQRSCFVLLLSTTYAIFSDPRDRIYGLLGLKTIEHDPADGRLLVDPDYSITTVECYRRVASKLLLEWHDLRVLSWAGCSPGSVKNWPSWVPDWNRSPIAAIGPLFDNAWNKNGRSSLTHISEIVKSGRNCIEVSGFRVDIAEGAVNEYADWKDMDNFSGPGRLQAILRFLAHVYSEECLACTFGNRFKYRPLSSTRTANLLSEYHMFTERDFTEDQYQPASVLRIKDDDTSFVPSADRFLDQCWHDRSGHALFITGTEMLVLGPEKALPCDVVVVLHGTSIPFVLRPATDGLWRLVGECYAYDVNEGRVHREWEEKGSVSEKFCIY